MVDWRLYARGVAVNLLIVAKEVVQADRAAKRSVAEPAGIAKFTIERHSSIFQEGAEIIVRVVVTVTCVGIDAYSSLQVHGTIGPELGTCGVYRKEEQRKGH